MLIRLTLFLFVLSGWAARPAQARQPTDILADSAIQARRPIHKVRTLALRIAVPSALVAVGVMAHSPNYSTILWQARQDVQAETQKVFGGFDSHGIDDYSRHAPLALAYGLMATGHRGERSAVGFTLIYLVAHELDEGIVSNLKRITAEPRPYNALDLSSFPSSHTAQAFLTATLLHEQYGRRYPWVSVSGYAVATATGAMRLMGNKHWATDVLAGAAIGFLSAETVWHLYPAFTKMLPNHLAHRLLLVPTYMPGAGAGAVLAFRP